MSPNHITEKTSSLPWLCYKNGHVRQGYTSMAAENRSGEIGGFQKPYFLGSSCSFFFSVSLSRFLRKCSHWKPPRSHHCLGITACWGVGLFLFLAVYSGWPAFSPIFCLFHRVGATVFFFKSVRCAQQEKKSMEVDRST